MKLQRSTFDIAAARAVLRGYLAWELDVQAGGRALQLLGPTGQSVQIRLPLMVRPASSAESLQNIIQRLPTDVGCRVIILIQAGAAAMGLWLDGELAEHKCMTAYMVRKKRGKSQLTYLQQKGKSRAGSRLRLRESAAFFERINERLAMWFERYRTPERIDYSIPVRLRPELEAADFGPPEGWLNRNAHKIPLDVKVPKFTELKRVNWFLTTGEIAVKSTDQSNGCFKR